MRRRKPSDLFINYAPIGGKRRPIEIVKADTAPIFRHEAHADIRCFGHLRSLRVSPVARFFLAADQKNKKSRRVDDPATTLARLPNQIQL